jgi:urease accessory protein UreH
MEQSARADFRPAAAIGRRARLELSFEYRRGRTVLTRAYAEPPLRVGRCLDAGSSAAVILVCCGPGMFAGDALSQRVHVEKGARVRLVSQAALQVHPRCGEEAAALTSFYDVAEDGSLDCFWDPVIPFASARLAQQADIRVAPGGRLFWSDALMAGRTGRGEAWQFAELRHELRLRVSDSTVYLERFRLTPASGSAIAQPWLAGASHYLGTTLAFGDRSTQASAEELHLQLAELSDVMAGVDCPAPRLLVSRLLARRGPQFATAREILRHAVGSPDPRRARL